jgi:hypothetical protein
MASKKKTPAQIQLEKERREFVQARPNLEKAEARKRFFVQKRAAELEAAGKPVDRKALRQKFETGGVKRAGFYTETDLKRIAATKAANNRGSSGKGSTTSPTRISSAQMNQVRRQSVQGWGQTPAGSTKPAATWKPDIIQRTTEAAFNPSNWMKWLQGAQKKAGDFVVGEAESLQATFVAPAWNQSVGRISPKLKVREAAPLEAAVNTAATLASIVGTPAAGATIKGLAKGSRAALTASRTGRILSKADDAKVVTSKIDDAVRMGPKPGELGGVKINTPGPLKKPRTPRATKTPTPVTRSTTAGGVRGAAQGAKGAAAGAKGAAKGAKNAASGAKVPGVKLSGRSGAPAVKVAKKAPVKKASAKKAAQQVVEAPKVETIAKTTKAAPTKAVAKKAPAKKATVKKAQAKKAPAKKAAEPKFEGMIYTGPRMNANFLETTSKASGSNLEMVSSDVINNMVQNQSKAMAKFVAEGGETVAKKAAAPRVKATNVAKSTKPKTTKAETKKVFDVVIGGQPKNIRSVSEATFKTTKELDKWTASGGKELLRAASPAEQKAFVQRNSKLIKELQETVSAQKKSSASAILKQERRMARYKRARPETQALYNRVAFAQANRQSETVGAIRSTARKTKKK